MKFGGQPLSEELGRFPLFRRQRKCYLEANQILAIAAMIEEKAPSPVFSRGEEAPLPVFNDQFRFVFFLEQFRL